MLNVIQHRNPSGIFRATSKSTEEWKYTKKGRENGARVNMSDLNQANAECLLAFLAGEIRNVIKHCVGEYLPIE